MKKIFPFLTILFSLFLVSNCHMQSMASQLEEEQRSRCLDTYIALLNAPPSVARDPEGRVIDAISNANTGLFLCLRSTNEINRGFLMTGDPEKLRP